MIGLRSLEARPTTSACVLLNEITDRHATNPKRYHICGAILFDVAFFVSPIFHFLPTSNHGWRLRKDEIESIAYVIYAAAQAKPIAAAPPSALLSTTHAPRSEGAGYDRMLQSVQQIKSGVLMGRTPAEGRWEASALSILPTLSLGAYAAHVLADMSADVIKIESASD